MRRFILVPIFLILCAFSTPEGIHYKHIATEIPQSIHILEVDPKKCTIIAARACDKCVGRETVLSLSMRKKALSGINGGFFAIGNHDGVPSGILKIDGRWYGLPNKPRGAIGWRAGGQNVIFDRVVTHQEGIDFHIDPQIDSDTGEAWENMAYVVGGTPLLIHHGEKITDFSPEKTLETFLTLRHARTAVGTLANGNWVFVIVDGKQPSWSIGMTMVELADFMENLGCVEALNLDGGGSSTFVYQNQVINQPAGDGDAHDDNIRVLRPVSDAILIFE
jgi:exopolysaccharide biosynthesis protein